MVLPRAYPLARTITTTKHNIANYMRRNTDRVTYWILKHVTQTHSLAAFSCPASKNLPFLYIAPSSVSRLYSHLFPSGGSSLGSQLVCRLSLPGTVRGATNCFWCILKYINGSWNRSTTIWPTSNSETGYTRSVNTVCGWSWVITSISGLFGLGTLIVRPW